MFKYLQFLLKSTNQHGVHSPFVYNYITKGLYKNKTTYQKFNKADHWLLLSIDYFKPQLLYIDSNNPTLGICNINHKFTSTISLANCIIVTYNEAKQSNILRIINEMSPTQVLLLPLHKYPATFINLLRKNHEITLVIDFYCGCLISKRQEQLKQNFYIRF